MDRSRLSSFRRQPRTSPVDCIGSVDPGMVVTKVRKEAKLASELASELSG